MAPEESGVQVLGRVVARTMTLAGIGVLFGGIGSFVASRVIASLLYGIEPTDALAFGAMVAILLSAAALAGFLPARKASRTDPMAALREE
jgi:ABC-type antimicrobial peptide transport system permease subunit